MKKQITQNLKNNFNQRNRLAGKMAAEKKKIVIAVVLTALMAVM